MSKICIARGAGARGHRPRRAGGSGAQFRKFLILALGSVGVVFGDMEPARLYALQTALGQFKGIDSSAVEIVGVVSLIIWALLIVVTAKYVLFLDAGRQQGRGRHPSLKALAQRALGKRTPRRLSARRRRLGAVLRRCDHDPGDFRPFGAGRPEAGQRGVSRPSCSRRRWSSSIRFSPRSDAARPE